jgi:hypothetical protein
MDEKVINPFYVSGYIDIGRSLLSYADAASTNSTMSDRDGLKPVPNRMLS